MPLTDAKIRSTKPAEKSLKLFDERGLYLEISPNGGKWWRLKYRFDVKEKRISLGIYPDVGLRAARERRDAARGLLTRIVHKKGRLSCNPLIKWVFRQERFGRS